MEIYKGEVTCPSKKEGERVKPEKAKGVENGSKVRIEKSGGVVGEKRWEGDMDIDDVSEPRKKSKLEGEDVSEGNNNQPEVNDAGCRSSPAEPNENNCLELPGVGEWPSN